MPPRICLLAFDGIDAFHLSIPYTVFGEDRRNIGLPRFELTVCAPEPGCIRSSMGLSMQVPHGVSAMQSADLVIVPSWRQIDTPAPEPVCTALAAAHAAGAQVVGLCLGAFPLADAGLLDGRSATTHWAAADLFAQRFPKVMLDSQVLYIDHGDVVTSAGTAAGLDCCLHLVRQHCGAALANRLARRLVTPPHRQGGQAQYVEQPTTLRDSADRVGRTLAWAQQHLHEPLDIDRLAGEAAMSRRSFTRHFQQATGMSVVQWLTQQRLFSAQKLLERTDAGLELIATQSGFGSAQSMRLAFERTLGTTPARYRREFRGAQ